MLSRTTVLVCPCSKAPTLAVRSHVQRSGNRLHTAARQCSCCWGATVESNPLSLASICWGSGARLGMFSQHSKGSQGAGGLGGPRIVMGDRSRAGPSRREEAFSIEEPTGELSHNLLSLPHPHVIQTYVLAHSCAAYWQIDTFSEMCSFCHSLWTDFLWNFAPPSILAHFQPFYGKLNQTMPPISQSSCVLSKSFAGVRKALYNVLYSFLNLSNMTTHIVNMIQCLSGYCCVLLFFDISRHPVCWDIFRQDCFKLLTLKNVMLILHQNIYVFVSEIQINICDYRIRNIKVCFWSELTPA